MFVLRHLTGILALQLNARRGRYISRIATAIPEHRRAHPVAVHCARDFVFDARAFECMFFATRLLATLWGEQAAS